MLAVYASGSASDRKNMVFCDNHAKCERINKILWKTMRIYKKNMKTNASSRKYTKTAANQRKPLKA